MKQLSFLDFVAVREEKNFRLIDVREQHEWDDVRAHGTELHPLSRLQAGVLPEKDDRPVAVICRSGGRSQVAIAILAGAGWGELINISDGTLGAIAAGAEHVERG